MHSLDRYLTTPPEPAPEVDEDEVMADLLRSLWRKHAGTQDAEPFLRFCREMEREGDFLEFFREGYAYELQRIREAHQEDVEGIRADMAYDRAAERRLGVD